MDKFIQNINHVWKPGFKFEKFGDNVDFLVIQLMSNTYIEKAYLFSWDEIPGKGDERFIEFLKDELKIEWVKTENISKIDDGRTIIVSNKEKSLSLKLNDDKTKVRLKIDDVRVDEFTVKTENGKLNIYEKAIKEKAKEDIKNYFYKLNPDCPNNIEIEIRLDNFMDLFVETLQIIKKDKQSRRYENHILDFMRELDRYANPVFSGQRNGGYIKEKYYNSIRDGIKYVFKNAFKMDNKSE